MTIDEIIERSLAAVVERLADVVVPEPAYAVGFYSGDDAALDVTSIGVGLESERDQWTGVVDADEARFLIWNPAEYSVELPSVPQLAATDEAFAAGQRAVITELLERDVFDPQQYVYNRIAARVDPASLPFARTDDFVVFAFSVDGYETAENIRFSAAPAALAILEAKGLLLELT